MFHNEEWLSKLKAGDKVFIDSKPATVTKVTPSGRIKAQVNGHGSEYEFNTDGRGRGDYDNYRLYEYTQERVDMFTRRRLINKLSGNVDFHGLTLAQLQAIDAIVYSEKKGE